MRDSNRKRIELRDKTVNYDLFCDLIYSAYTDEIRSSEENLIPLIALAQEYQFPSVIALAAHQLHDFVTVNNAIATARFVETNLIQPPFLRAYCFGILAIYFDLLHLSTISSSKSLSMRGFFPGSGKLESRSYDSPFDESILNNDNPILKHATEADIALLKSLIDQIQSPTTTISSFLRKAFISCCEKIEISSSGFLLSDLTETESEAESHTGETIGTDTGSESSISESILNDE